MFIFIYVCPEDIIGIVHSIHSTVPGYRYDTVPGTGTLLHTYEENVYSGVE